MIKIQSKLIFWHLRRIIKKVKINTYFKEYKQIWHPHIHCMCMLVCLTISCKSLEIHAFPIWVKQEGGGRVRKISPKKCDNVAKFKAVSRQNRKGQSAKVCAQNHNARHFFNNFHYCALCTMESSYFNLPNYLHLV